MLWLLIEALKRLDIFVFLFVHLIDIPSVVLVEEEFLSWKITKKNVFYTAFD